jgi:DNA damage-inducible protein 1
VRELKGSIESETGLPAHAQSLYLNGQPVADETLTLDAAGIRDGEMLAVLIRRAPQAPARPQHDPRGRPVQQPDPEGVRQHVLNNPQAQHDLRARDPQLAAALSDPNTWRDAFAMRQRQQDDAERERHNQIALLNEDPFNIDAQKKIEELIRQDRVVENLEKAYNENPEGACHASSPYSANPSSVCPRSHALRQHRG